MAEKYEFLEKFRQEMLTCTMCGFCKNVCPVFLDEGWDSSAPRGRMTLAYGLLTGELEPDMELVDKLYQCTQCTDCYRRCPSSAKCPDVVIAARREMVHQGRTRPEQELLAANVEAHGNIFADKNVEFPLRAGAVPMFIGCQHLSRPNATKKSIRLLESLGVDVNVIPEICCGFPLEIMGFEEAHHRQKERLQAAFPMDGREIVTLCPSCLVHLQREYGQPAIHALQVIAERIETMQLKPQNLTVTYHDPCDMSRGAKIVDEPRTILKAMGCEVLEMSHIKDQSRCCGGGGGILTWDSALSDRMSQTRIEEAIATGADMVVTSCPTCEQTLKKGAKQVAAKNGGKPIKVRHILDLIQKSLA